MRHYVLMMTCALFNILFMKCLLNPFYFYFSIQICVHLEAGYLKKEREILKFIVEPFISFRNSMLNGYAAIHKNFIMLRTKNY